MSYQARREITCLLCDKISIARKLCRPHYLYIRKHKRLAEFPILGPEDVFEHRYKISENGCWEWQGTFNSYGYGIFLLPGEVPVRAHRYMFEKVYGQIPDGKIVMHTCDNPPCVNPEHLRLGTKDDNNKDTAIKRRHNYGLDHWNGRLSDDDIQAIQSSAERNYILAKRYAVDPSHISRIRSGQARK